MSILAECHVVLVAIRSSTAVTRSDESTKDSTITVSSGWMRTPMAIMKFIRVRGDDTGKDGPYFLGTVLTKGITTLSTNEPNPSRKLLVMFRISAAAINFKIKFRSIERQINAVNLMPRAHKNSNSKICRHNSSISSLINDKSRLKI